RQVVFETSGTPFFDARGNLLGYRGIDRDITERKQAEEERERFTLQLGTAADIAAQISALLDPDQIVDAAITQLKERFGLYHVHVYILDEASGMLNLRAGYGEAGEKMLAEGHAIPLDREVSLVARAARTREIVLVDDVAQAPDFMPNPLLPDTKSEVAVPGLSGDKLVGVFDIQHDQAHYFTQADLDVFSTLTGQLATAFQNAELFEEMQARLRVSQALAPAQTEDEVLDAMIETASFYPQGGVGIALFDQQAEELTLVVHRQDAFDSEVMTAPEGTRLTISQLPSLRRLTADEELVIANSALDEGADQATRALNEQLGVVSNANLPITAGDEWLGTIIAVSSEEGYFDEHKLHLYRNLAEQGATALRTARLYEETQKVAEQLQEVNQLKSEFMADMSHELRTPLNSIIGYTELMLMGVSEMAPDTLEDVQAIYDNGQHLLRIINDLLDLAKIEAGRMELDLEEIHIPSLLEEIKTSSAGLLINKPVELLIEVEQNLPPIEADRVRVSQILNNLIGNAIKFTEEGSITMRAFGDTGDGGWVCLEVKDTGDGMSEEDLQEIFGRFKQGGSLTQRAEGTGLGLDITRHLVELHGGTIDVHSQLGEGSTFTVRLPVK
ncbi:MAG: ATP-binding protein, partial [Chloroflexota bacterium]|nr:ATP-binding protein [Chloroflexota bacterium]